MDVIFVCGISAGAVINLYLADRHQYIVRALGLCSITLKWDGWGIPKSKVLAPFALLIPYIAKKFYFSEAFPYGIKNESLRKRIVAKLNSGDTSAAEHTHTPGITLRELWKMAKKVKKRFPYIHTSSLIVYANNDDIAGLKKNALYLQKHLAGSTELLILYDSYHLVTVAQERHKVSDETVRFFVGYLESSEYGLLIAVAKNNISNIKKEYNLQLQNDNRDALVAV